MNSTGSSNSRKSNKGFVWRTVFKSTTQCSPPLFSFQIESNANRTIGQHSNGKHPGVAVKGSKNPDEISRRNPFRDEAATRVEPRAMIPARSILDSSTRLY